MIRRMEDDRENMREILRDRNRQIANLITRLKTTEQIMKEKDQHILRLE